MKKMGIIIGYFLSATMASATVVTTFTGGDLADGLDLSGDFVYAVNVAGHTQYPPTIQGVTFTNDTLVSGVTVTLGGSSNDRPVWWSTQPSYDSGAGNDYQLSASLMHSTALSYGTAASIAVELDVTAGQAYELQLLFSENYYSTANARHFDIAVEGATIVDELTTTPTGAEWTTAPHTGVLVTYQLTAGDSVINVDLTEGSSGNTKPILQGITLKEIEIQPQAVVSTFTGGDVADGLDLSGEFVYAVSVAGHTQYPPTIQGHTFTNDTLVSGVTVTLGGSSNSRPVWWATQPSYDSGAGNDYQLGAGLMHSTALSSGTDPSISVSLDVVSGQSYELQLLFSENTYQTANARHFDIQVEGSTIVNEFTTIPAGAEWSTAPHTGVLVTYEVIAGDAVLNVELTEGSTGDTTPVLQGLTLKTTAASTPPPPPSNDPLTNAVVSTFTGGDVADGLDLSGEFVYAVSVAGHTQYPSTIQGHTFTNDTLVSGVTVTLGGSSNSRPVWWATQPSYDSGAGNDYQLGTGLMHSTALSSGTDPSISVALDVVSGQSYELQLLFSENTYQTANARHFDIQVEGSTIVDEFTTIPAGAEWSTAPHTGVLVTYEVIAGDAVLNVELTEGSTGDTTPVLQGLTLKTTATSTPPPPPAPSDFYVSLNGDDSGTGTINDPLQTIGRACELVQAGGTVYLREGAYSESLQPLVSGSAGNPITFTNYDNEDVVLVSGQPISGWTALGGGIYKASTPVDLGEGFNQLVCEGDLMIEARYPNVDSKDDLPFVFKTGNALPTYFHQQDHYTYAQGDYVEVFEGGEGAQTTDQVWYVGLHNQAWGTQVARVTPLSAEVLDIVYKTEVECFHGAGQGYLVGAYEFLDHPNEWFLDADTDEIFFIPPTGVDPNQSTLYLKDTLAAIDLSDKQHIVVDGVDTWMGTVKMTNSQECVVRNSTHLYGGHHRFVDNIYGQHRNGENTTWYATGFFVSGLSNVIERCEIAYNAGASIMMTGQGHEVVNSRIHDSGLLGNYASGIFFLSDFYASEQLGGHIVASNTLYNLGRSAINIGSDGVWGNPGIYAHPLQLHHNYIANAMLIADDGGAIYDFVTDGNGSTISHNVIRDSYSSGIYLDNYSRGFDVHHNVVYQMDGSHIRVNGPGNERVYFCNNTIFDPGYFPNDAFVGNGDILLCDNIATLYGIHPKNVDFSGTGSSGTEFQPLYASQVPQGVVGGPGVEQYTRLPYSGAFAAVGVETPWEAGADWGGPIPPLREGTKQQLWACDYSNASGFLSNAGYVVSQTQGAWLSYTGIDFGQGYSKLFFRAIVDAQSEGGTVEIRIGSSTGTLIGSTTVAANSNGDVFEYRCIELSPAQGNQDLFLVCNAGAGVVIMDAVLIGPQGKMSRLLPANNGGRLLYMRESTLKRGMWWQDNKVNRTLPGDWMYFPKVDFGGLCNKAFIELSLQYGGEGGVIEFRSGTLDGPLLGQHAPYGTGTTLGETFEEQVFELNNVSGVHDLFMVFKNVNCGNIHSLRLLPDTTVWSFSGGDAGEGIGLIGDYDYMVDIGGGTANRTIQGYTFTAAGVTPGVSVTATGGGTYSGGWGTIPEYGSSTSDNYLEQMMLNTSLAWASASATISVDLDVGAGQYELTLLFSENAYDGSAGRRYLDVVVEGVQIMPNVDTLNGDSWANSNPDVGTAITYTLPMDNSDKVINIQVTGGDTPGDHNPILQGLTLKKVSPLVVSSFVGGDAGEGLGLSGTYVYMVDLGGGAASRTIQSYLFTADDVTPGVTTTLTGGGVYAGVWGTLPEYGSSSSDNDLEQMMWNTPLAWTDAMVSVELDVVAGQEYELSLFFSENFYDGSGTRRYLDVFVQGTLLQPDLDTLNGDSWTASSPDVGTVLTYTVTMGASDTSLHIDVAGGVVAGDHNPVLQGLTLQNTAP